MKIQLSPNKEVYNFCEPYIIAEIGANHNGDMDLAKKMIRLAGYSPDKEIKIKIVGLRPGEKLYEELLYDATKTLPTHHAKILIAQDLSNYDYAVFNAFMKTLHAHAVAFDFDQAVRLMKQMVPEFKSQNSVFEQFDV